MRHQKKISPLQTKLCSRPIEADAHLFPGSQNRRRRRRRRRCAQKNGTGKPKVQHQCMLAASLSLHASCHPPVLFHHSIGSGNAKYKHSKRQCRLQKYRSHPFTHSCERKPSWVPSAKERKGGIHTLLALWVKGTQMQGVVVVGGERPNEPSFARVFVLLCLQLLES